jgi:ubiquinone/menaquinone biosynthesis C-methylase UbiE
MLGFRKLYVVDYHSALLKEIEKNVKAPNIELLKNNGTDFPGIDHRSVDYLFSFGTFVHLDGHLIQAYLGNMKRILKAGANVVIHYSDKTKVIAQINESFAENTPAKMRLHAIGSGL